MLPLLRLRQNYSLIDSLCCGFVYTLVVIIKYEALNFKQAHVWSCNVKNVKHVGLYVDQNGNSARAAAMLGQCSTLSVEFLQQIIIGIR